MESFKSLNLLAGFGGACLSLLAMAGTTAPAAAQPQQEGKTGRVAIEYVPPTHARYQQIYNVLREHKALEKFQEVFAPFRLPTTLTLKTMTCGMTNAWYQRPTLTICYEYLEDIQKSLPKDNKFPEGLTKNDLIIGQFFYVVAHEMGHAFFDQLNVPLFGRAEDAADGFAAYMMLKLGKKEARRLIGGAAYSYKDYINKPRVTISTTAFADAHGAPMQRFYNLLCFAYGADPGGYGDLVEKNYLPKDRARSCRMEYGELNFAFQQLIRPHVDREMARSVLERDWLGDEKPMVPETRASDLPAGK